MWLGFLIHGLGSEKEVPRADSPRDHMKAHDLRPCSRSHIVSYSPHGLADAVTACLTEREATQMQYLEGRSGKDIVILFLNTIVDKGYHLIFFPTRMLTTKVTRCKWMEECHCSEYL